jgi:NADPH-dependent 2,4-dienoyl-CoA reductase/sulfur reductase-like enzyme
MLRDKEFFQGAKDIEVLTNTEALSIDRQEKKVHIQNLTTGEDTTLPYDELVLATGSRPRRLDIPGIDLEGVFAVSNMNAAIAIKERIASGQVESALIIGGGFIGLEMAEALTDMWGIETTGDHRPAPSRFGQQEHGQDCPTSHGRARSCFSAGGQG